MIRHIVLFTAKDTAHIDQILEGLSLLTTIPHARRLEVARNFKTDQLGNDIDVVVYGEFDNEAELAAHKAHELYQRSTRRVRPLRKLFRSRRVASSRITRTDALGKATLASTPCSR